MRRLSWLYPAEWRELYGAELDELLEQTPFGWHTLIDVLVGALDARLHPELPRAIGPSSGPGRQPREATANARGGAAMRGPKSERRFVRCSFCGKGPEQVKKLVAGPGVYICDSCIHLANKVLEDDAGGNPAAGIGPGARGPGRPRPPARPVWSALWEDLRRLWRGARAQPTSS